MVSSAVSMLYDRWDGRRPPAALSAVAVGVYVVLLSSSVMAAPPDRDKARAKLVEGVKLLEADRPAQALARFEEAYAIVPSAKIQYNMALAYRRLGRFADAYRAFDRFLREAPEENAQHLSHARQELERLSKRVAFVELASDVPGAEVLLDGRRVGVTPLPGRLPVDTGPHELLVRSPPLADQSRRFTAVAAEPINLRIELRRAAAPLPVPQQLLPPREATPLADRAQVGRFTPESPSPVAQAPETPAPPASGLRKIAGVTLLAASLAGAATGVALLAIHGKPTCENLPQGAQCDTNRDTKLLGWSFVAAGAAAAVGGGLLLYQSSRTNVSLAVIPTALIAEGRF